MSRLSLCLALGALASSVAAAEHHTIDLVARRGSPAASARRSARSKRASTVPLTDYYAGGEDLQWYGNISVGTPAQTISVVFDTGSDTLEFPSTACTSGCSTQHRFDTSKSSTFVNGGQTNTLQFATGVNTLPVTSNSQYTLHLRSGTDTVTVGGVTAKKSPLWLITSQTAAFSVDPFDGIMGMPADGSGFLSHLSAAGLQSLFTMYLTPKSVGSAQLTLGSIDSTKYTGTLHYASVPEYAGDWELTSSAIYVNGKTTSALKASRQVVFDSGTSNVLFPTATAEAIYALISPDIQPIGDYGEYGIACSKIAALPAQIDISFTDMNTGAKFNLTIPSQELNAGPVAGSATMCQTLINAYDGLNLVGGSLLKHWFSVWDFGNSRMGFAKNGA